MTNNPDKDEVVRSNRIGPIDENEGKTGVNEASNEIGSLFPSNAKQREIVQTLAAPAVVKSVETIRVFTYFIQSEKGGPIKIGRAIDPKKRLASLQTGSAYKLRFLLILDGDQESVLHSRFDGSRLEGEWFQPSQDILDFITQNYTCPVVDGMGGLDRKILETAKLPLLVNHFCAVLKAHDWIPIDPKNIEGWEIEFFDHVQDFHLSVAGCELEKCEPSCPVDEEDIEECCEFNMVYLGCEQLPSAILHGTLFRKSDLSVFAVINWPEAPGLRDGIAKQMEWAAFYLDYAQISLHAILVNPDSTYQLVGAGDVYGGRLCNPRGYGAVDSIMGFAQVIPGNAIAEKLIEEGAVQS